MNRSIAKTLFYLVSLTMFFGCESGDFTGSPESFQATTNPVAASAAAPQVRAQNGGWTPPTGIVQADVTATGVSANEFSKFPALNEDGSVIVFTSKSTNLDGASNGLEQTFRKDLVSGDVTLVSATSSGPSNHHTYWPAVSPSGEKTAFFTPATNLDPAATVVRHRVYVTETGGDAEMVSQNASGVYPNKNSTTMRFVDDERIIFHSQANNLLPDANSGRFDVFQKNLTTGALSIESKNAVGGQPNHHSYVGDMSEDGNYVAFLSYGANIGGETSLGYRVWLRDVQTGVPTLASSGLAWPSYPRLSADGSKVAFFENVSDSVWVYDRVTGSLTMEFDGAVNYIALSDDGRFLVAIRDDDPAFPEDNDGKRDVYVKDLATGNVALVTGDFGYNCNLPDISGDGSTIAFRVAHVYVTANPLAGFVPPSTPQMVSVSESGVPNDASANGVLNGSLSDSGRYLLFNSKATNLHPDGTSGETYVYRKDIVTGEVLIISRSEIDGGVAKSEFEPYMNAAGDKVLFKTRRGDLTSPSFPSGFPYDYTYLRDATSGVTSFFTEEFSVQDFVGDDLVGLYSETPVPSENDLNLNDAFMLCLSNPILEHLSTPPDIGPDVNCHTPRLSSDGRYAAFLSYLPSSYQNVSLYHRDHQTGSVNLIAENIKDYDLSGDGLTVAYVQSINGAPYTSRLYIDRLDDSEGPRLVTVTQGINPYLSNDGLYLAYRDTNTPQYQNSGSGAADWVYRWDNQTSLELAPQLNFPRLTDLSGDGSTLLFRYNEHPIGQQYYVVKNPHL